MVKTGPVRSKIFSISLKIDNFRDMIPETDNKIIDLTHFCSARELSIGRLTWRLKRYMDSYLEVELHTRGFRDFKSSYLVFLANIDENGTTNTELARRAGVTKQAMSKIVRLLEDEGYIYLVRNEKDSRSSRILINERGHELFRAVVSCMQNLQEKFDAIAGPRQIDQMLGTLSLLVDELDQET
ncbi:hypothetical protein GCM10023187_41500 [Nibrella viscosa]|uniref:HTH marR-type domain-containing protein n=2 Tax=Nibrella viscosa TaxID=1084524 RepID=A0ABP8KSB5_9BACT